jgi:serine/threonine protein kinase
MTMPGQICGTPLYWPREQITHYKYLYPATDVFSMAATFYRVLTAEYIREGFREMLAECEDSRRQPGLADYLTAIAANRVVPIRQRDPRLPPPIAQVLDRALAEPEVPGDENRMRAVLAETRFADATAFRGALMTAAAQAGLAT